ncbi:MAG: hypothetical protein MJZ18_08070 [Bacteroidales bacterium]|nr:hypothetical protein [Bacteroidales bacterium]
MYKSVFYRIFIAIILILCPSILLAQEQITISDDFVVKGDKVIEGNLLIEKGARLIFDSSDSHLFVHGNIVNRGEIIPSGSEALVNLSVKGNIVNTGKVVVNSLLVTGRMSVSAGSVDIPHLTLGVVSESGIGEFLLSGGVVRTSTFNIAETAMAYVNGGSIEIAHSEQCSVIEIDFRSKITFGNIELKIKDCHDVTISSNNTSFPGLRLEESDVECLDDSLVIDGNLTLSDASSLIFKGSIDFQGSVMVDESSSILSDAPSYCTVFSGNRDTYYDVRGTFLLQDILVSKADSASLTFVTEDAIELTGSFSAHSGRVVGKVRFIALTQQYIDGRDADLTGLTLMITSSLVPLRLKSDIHVKSLVFERFQSLINPAIYKLRLDEQPICLKSDFKNFIFSGIQIDPKVPTPVVEVPIKKDFILPFIGPESSHAVSIEYTVEGATALVSFVPYLHTTLSIENTKQSDRFFLKVKTSEDVKLSPNQTTYTCYYSGVAEDADALCYVDGEWNVCGKVIPGTKYIRYDGVTEGDFYFGSIPDLHPKTYVSTRSSSYDGRIWALKDKDEDELHTFDDFKYGDTLIISPGNTINTTCSKKYGTTFCMIKCSVIDIQRNGDNAGKLIIKYEDLMGYTEDYSRRIYIGNGILEYHTWYLTGDVNNNRFSKADFSPFMSNPESLFIFHNEKEKVLLSKDNIVYHSFLGQRHLCNTIFTGERMLVSGIAKDLFMGDVNIQTDMNFYGDDVEFAKDVIIAEGKTVVFSNNGHYTIKGNLINNGTLIVKDDAILDFQGNVQNNGAMHLENVHFSGEANTKVCGAPIEFGIITINKLTDGIVTLETNDSDLSLSLKSGTIHLPSIITDPVNINLVNDKICSKGTLWLSNANTIFTSPVLCEGGLMVDNEAKVNFGNNSLLYQGVFSKIHVKDKAIVSANTVSPYSIVNSTPEFILDNDGLLNVRTGLNLIGGSLSMRGKSRIMIEESGNIHYDCHTVSISPSSAICIYGVIDVSVSSLTPLPNVVISEKAKVKAVGCSMKIQGDLFVAENSMLDMAGCDLILGGNLAINGEYVHDMNTTIFNGDGEQSVSISSGVLGSLKVESCNLHLLHDIEVCGDALELNKGAHIVGNGRIILNGSVSQSLYVDGIVDNLVIDNQLGVMARGTLPKSIQIGKQLTLKRGILDIGSNVVELLPGAVIDGGDFSKDCYIRVSQSPSLSGVKIHLNATEGYSSLIPVGIGDSYSPVSLSDLRSSTTGALLIAPRIIPMNDKIMPLCWVVASESIAPESGKVSFSVSELGENEQYLLFVSPSDNSVSVYDRVNMKKGMHSAEIGISESQVCSSFNGIFAFGECVVPYYKLISKHDITSMKSVSSDDWDIFDTNGNVIADMPLGDCVFSMEINHNVSINEYGQGLHCISCVVNKGAKLNLGSAQGVYLGQVSGGGTIKVESAHAEPDGIFDRFLSVDGGTFEYGGDSDYEIMLRHNRFNNVVVSGSGKKTLANGTRIIVGNLHMSSANIQLDLPNNSGVVSLRGNLYLDEECTTCNLPITMDGHLPQFIIGKPGTSANMSFLKVDNCFSVESNVDISAHIVELSNGLLILHNHSLSVSGDVKGGNDKSYISGTLKRYLSMGDECCFYVGDKIHSGPISICAENDGWWQAEYYHSPCDEVACNAPYSISHGYWQVLSLSDPTDYGRVRLFFDELSGSITSHSHIMTIDVNGGQRCWRPIDSYTPFGTKYVGSLCSQSILGSASPHSASPRFFALGDTEHNSLCIWTGIDDDAWDNANNWQGCAMPCCTSEVLIGKGHNNPVVRNFGAAAANITIAEDATLSLYGANAGLSVQGSIYNYGSLDLYYQYTKVPQLEYGGVIFDNGGLNKPNIYRSFLRGRSYYTGSATREGTFSNLLALNMQGGDVLHQYDSFSRSFYNVDKLQGESLAQQAGCLILNYSQHSSNGRNDNHVIQQGAPVNTMLQYTAPLARGWHWLANPYPFTVDIQGFIDVRRGRINPTIYVRGYKQDAGYAGYLFYTYNLVENVSVAGNLEDIVSSLAPFEGFAVFVEEDETVLVLNPVKHDEGSTSLKSVPLLRNDMLRVTVGSGFRKDEVVLVFKSGGSMQSHLSDSYKYSYQPRSSYQIFTRKDAEDIAIAIMPKVDNIVSQEIPICITATLGDGTKPIVEFPNINDFDDEWEVFFVDHHCGRIVNVRQMSTYIIPDAGVLSAGRFSVRFEPRGTIVSELSDIATSDNNIVESDPIVVKRIRDSIFISGNPTLPMCITIYDIMGRVVKSQMAHGEVSLTMPKNSLYIIQVQQGEISCTKQLVM